MADTHDSTATTTEKILSWPFQRPPGHPQTLSAEYDTVRSSPSDAVKVQVWSGACPYLAAHYSSTQEAFGNADLFSSDPRTPGYVDRNPAFAETVSNDRNFRTMDGEEHTAHRALVQEDFSRRRLNIMQPLIEATADELVEEMSRRAPEPADVISGLALPLAISSLANLVGVPVADREYFSSRVAACVSGTEREQAARSAQDLLIYTQQLLDSKKDNPGDDLASRMMEKVATGAISRAEADSTVRMVLIGGFETTANTIGLGILAVLTNDDQRQLLIENLDDAKFMANAVNEVLRVASVLQLGQPRVAVKAGRLGELEIAQGDAVICSAAVANYDPEMFENPERFDLQRRNAIRHLSFGHGKHSCVAQSLARIEITAALRVFFTRLGGARLAMPEEALPVKQRMDQTFGLVCLPVVW